MKNCPECKSEKIIKDAEAINTDSSQLKIAVAAQPDALIMKKRVYSDVKAEVCADCGYVRFFAVDPQELWSAYQKR
jgi:transcription initiation factor TFIIIB Brf1 subunit/transcription initiation factor TFIIB